MYAFRNNIVERSPNASARKDGCGAPVAGPSPCHRTSVLLPMHHPQLPLFFSAMQPPSLAMTSCAVVSALDNASARCVLDGLDEFLLMRSW